MDLPVPTQALVLMAIVGGVFLVVGVRYLRTPRRVGWLTVTGTVVRWEGGGVEDAALPVVEYPLPDGSLRQFRNRTSIDIGFRGTGHQVAVLVDPEDPTRAELPATTTQARVLGGFLAAFGVLILLAAGAVLTVALAI